MFKNCKKFSKNRVQTKFIAELSILVDNSDIFVREWSGVTFIWGKMVLIILGFQSAVNA
jgi:hypothetical protein